MHEYIVLSTQLFTFSFVDLFLKSVCASIRFSLIAYIWHPIHFVRLRSEDTSFDIHVPKSQEGI